MRRHRLLLLLSVITGLFIILLALRDSANVAGAMQAGQPAVVEAVAPSYPVFIGVPDPSGRVDVGLELDGAGKVTSVHAINGHPLLQIVAEHAAKRWHFDPATSKLGPRTVLITFLFTILPKGSLAEEATTIFSPPYQVEVKRLPSDVSKKDRR